MVIDVIAQRLYEYDKKNYQLRLEELNQLIEDPSMSSGSKHYQYEKKELEQTIKEMNNQTPKSYMIEVVDDERSCARVYVRNSQYYFTITKDLYRK